MSVKGKIEIPINLGKKDGDERKSGYVRAIFKRHLEVLPLWRSFGLLGKSESKKRNFDTSEHMIGVASTCYVVGSELKERGYIDKQDVLLLENAALVHDLLKDVEVGLIKRAIALEFDPEAYQNFLTSTTLILGIENKTKELLIAHSDRLFSNDPGARGLAAYDLAGEINVAMLLHLDIPAEVVDIQKMIGHTACVDIEKVLKDTTSTGQLNRLFILQLIMHYADDIVTANEYAPNVIVSGVRDGKNALDFRCIQNMNNPKYSQFNNAWLGDSRGNGLETAYELQRRVGHMVEARLSAMLGVDDPLSLPDFVNSEVRKRMDRMSVK